MNGRRVSPIGFTWQLGWRTLATLLCFLGNPCGVQAQEDTVRVVCPQLSGEKAAELESHARATLLASELAARASIACSAEASAEIHVEAAGVSVTLQARTTPTTLRDDVLRSFDEALQELRRRIEARRSEAAPAEAVVPSAPASVTPSSPPPSAPPKAAPARPKSRPHLAEGAPAWQSEISGLVTVAAWSEQVALGGGLRVALSRDSGWWYGVGFGEARAIGVSDFTVSEDHAFLELGFGPRFAAGFRWGVGLGPSVMFVRPESGLSPRDGTTRAAFAFEAQLSRPFRFGRFAFAPSVALRLFSAERGVRVHDEPRLVLGLTAPQAALSLTYCD